MSRKAKGMPRRWSTASNLLMAHLAFHIVFVFGYWFSLGASLSVAESNVIQNHAAVLSGMLTNHLALLIVLVVHIGAVVANNWRRKRQHSVANQQFESVDDHMTAEQKLELLLDEVVELREALYERGDDERVGYPEQKLDRLRGRNQADEDAMIRLRDNQAVQARQEL